MRLLIFQLSFLFFIAASALLSANALGGGKGRATGGWEPIKDLNDPYVKEIADFAVTEHNKQHSSKRLKLDSIKDGQRQVVAGTNYRLVIAAADGTATKRYEAVVWDKPWAHFRNLTSFNSV